MEKAQRENEKGKDRRQEKEDKTDTGKSNKGLCVNEGDNRVGFVCGIPV